MNTRPLCTEFRYFCELILTLTGKPKSGYAICPVCFWEDDPSAYEEPDEAFGCNGVSLAQARENFQKFGACREEMRKYTRVPKAEEMSSG